MKNIVISGVNIVAGGMLSVFKDCLLEATKYLDLYKITVFVHRKELFAEFDQRFEFIECPKAKTSWFWRCYYEYRWFKKYSQDKDIYFWLSLHDMSPLVKADFQAVYCHNSAPFYKMPYKDYFIDFKVTLFTLFYKFLYRINIYSNRYIIVQQEWMRHKFQELFKLDNIIVAHPCRELILVEQVDSELANNTFIYPTLPSVYKNIEVICEAIQCLKDIDIKVLITIDGTENAYAKKIVAKYGHNPNLRFIGLQPRSKIFEYYSQVTGMIFPSKLETWGMPLSEFASTKKPIIAVDKEYARETLSGYERVQFFPENDYIKLASILKELVIDKTFATEIAMVKNEEPFAKNWRELFEILLRDVR